MSTSATRRNLCRSMVIGSVAAMTAGTAVAQPTSAGPDDELIRLCLQFDALEAQRPSSDPADWENMPEDELLRIDDAVSERQEALLPRIEALRATTVAGLRARTRTLLRFAPDLLDDVQANVKKGFWDSRMFEALLRDLMGEMPA